MKWMKYAAYLGYLTYVYAIYKAAIRYKDHKAAHTLALEVSREVFNAVNHATKGQAAVRVSRSKVDVAMRQLTDLYTGVID